MIPLTVRLKRKEPTEVQIDQRIDDILGDILGKSSDNYCIEGEIIVKTVEVTENDSEDEEDTYKEECINNRIYELGRNEINRTIINRMSQDEREQMNRDLSDIKGIYSIYKRLDISGKTTWYKKRKKDLTNNVAERYIQDELNEGRLTNVQQYMRVYSNKLINDDLDYVVEEMDKTYERLINSLELFNRRYGLNIKLYELNLDNIFEE